MIVELDISSAIVTRVRKVTRARIWEIELGCLETKTDPYFRSNASVLRSGMVTHPDTNPAGLHLTLVNFSITKLLRGHT